MRIIILLGFAMTALVIFGARGQSADTPFSIKLESISVSCEKWVKTTVEYTAPDGYRVIAANVRWIDMEGVSNTMQRIIDRGKTLKAEGAIHGQGKLGVVAGVECPRAGRGTLELFGSMSRQ
jgi:hypothetical protein